MVSAALPLDQTLGLTLSFNTDPRNFGWIGNFGDSNLLTYTFHPPQLAIGQRPVQYAVL